VTRGLPLAALFAGIAGGAVACSGGEKSSGATVIGRVQDEAGTPIDDADVVFDGESTSTTATGTFTFAAKKGTSVLDVRADGFRRVTVELRIGGGDNDVEITMVVCTPVVDVGCDVPTPTPTPTPTPAPNVTALFSGLNSNLDNGGGPLFDLNWNGDATLVGAATTLTYGTRTDASDLAFAECWIDAAQTNDWDGMGVPDHCVFWWEGEDEGGIVIAGLNDGVFYVSIPGAEFTSGNIVTLADGMTAGYYEGDFTVDGFRIADYTLQRAATFGTLEIGNAGMNDAIAVSITGQATFYIPNLP